MDDSGSWCMLQNKHFKRIIFWEAGICKWYEIIKVAVLKRLLCSVGCHEEQQDKVCISGGNQIFHSLCIDCFWKFSGRSKRPARRNNLHLSWSYFSDVLKFGQGSPPTWYLQTMCCCYFCYPLSLRVISGRFLSSKAGGWIGFLSKMKHTLFGEPRSAVHSQSNSAACNSVGSSQGQCNLDRV